MIGQIEPGDALGCQLLALLGELVIADVSQVRLKGQQIYIDSGSGELSQVGQHLRLHQGLIYAEVAEIECANSHSLRGHSQSINRDMRTACCLGNCAQSGSTSPT